MKRTIRTDSTFDVLMRVHVNGANAVQSDLSGIAWRVVNSLDETQYNAGGSLTVSSVVFDTLQTDGRWTADSTGYNFRHSVAHTVFTAVGDYVMDYTFTTSGGSQFKEQYPITAVKITQSIYE